MLYARETEIRGHVFPHSDGLSPLIQDLAQSEKTVL